MAHEKQPRQERPLTIAPKASGTHTHVHDTHHGELSCTADSCDRMMLRGSGAVLPPEDAKDALPNVSADGGGYLEAVLTLSIERPADN